MSKKIEIINGPNINLLGKREPNIYGDLTLENINKEIEDYAKELNLKTLFFQSNIEGEIVNKIQDSVKAMVLLLMRLHLHIHQLRFTML